jgi:hypothetical protein
MPCGLESSSNLKKEKNIIKICMKKMKKIMEKYIVELRTCCLALPSEQATTQF